MLLFTFLFLLLSPAQADEKIQVDHPIPDQMPMFSEAKQAYAKSTDKPYACKASLRWAKSKMEGKNWEKVIAYNPATFLKDEALAQVETCEDVGGKGKKSRVRLVALVANIGKTNAYKNNLVTGRRAVESWTHLEEQRVFGSNFTVKVKPARGALFFFDSMSTNGLRNAVDNGMDAKDLHEEHIRAFILFKSEIVEQLQKAFTLMDAVPEINGLFLEVKSSFYNEEGSSQTEYWTYIMRTDEIAKLVESEFTLGQFLDSIIVKRGTTEEDIAARALKINWE